MDMEVFIEYAAIDNFLMDYMLIDFAAKLARVRTTAKLTFFGALVGAAIAVVLPLFSLPRGVAFIVKILLGMLICLVSAKKTSFFGYLRFFNVFLLLTFISGGAIIGVMTLFGLNYADVINPLTGIFPFSLILFGIFAAVKIVGKILVRNAGARSVGECECECRVTARGKTVRLSGFVDTGNFLCDEKTNLPVAVCTERARRKIFGDESAARHIPVSSAGGIFFVGIYDIDKISVSFGDKQFVSDAVLGVASSSRRFAGGAEIIVGAELLNKKVGL